MTALKLRIPSFPPALWGLVVAYVAIAINTTVVSVALPPITKSLHVRADQLTWIVNCTPLSASALMLFAGFWCQKFGHKRVLITGMCILMISCVGSSMVQHVDQLIAFRTFSGVGSALVMPSALVMSYQVVEESMRRTAIGLITAAQAIGGLIGPLIGGLLISCVSWRLSLVAIAPLVLFAIVVVVREAPSDSVPQSHKTEKSDVFAALYTACVGTFAIVFLVSLTAAEAINTAQMMLLFLLAASLFLLVRHERKFVNPLFRWHQLKKPAFLMPTLIVIAVQFVYGGCIFLNMQYLQLVVGMTAFHASFFVVASTLVWILCSSFVSPLSKRLGQNALAIAGLLLASVGYGLMGTAGTSPNLPLLMIGFILSGCVGVEPAIMIYGILGTYDSDRRSIGASLNTMLMRYGLSSGIAVSGLILSWAYLPQVLPLNGSLDLVQQKLVRGSLGGAINVATSLGGEAGEALLEAAKQGFASGYHNFFMISIVLYVACSALIASNSLSRSRPWILHLSAHPFARKS